MIKIDKIIDKMNAKIIDEMIDKIFDKNLIK